MGQTRMQHNADIFDIEEGFHTHYSLRRLLALYRYS
jgi:hypothetical protein